MGQPGPAGVEPRVICEDGGGEVSGGWRQGQPGPAGVEPRVTCEDGGGEVSGLSARSRRCGAPCYL